MFGLRENRFPKTGFNPWSSGKKPKTNVKCHYKKNRANQFPSKVLAAVYCERRCELVSVEAKFSTKGRAL